MSGQVSEVEEKGGSSQSRLSEALHRQQEDKRWGSQEAGMDDVRRPQE